MATTLIAVAFTSAVAFSPPHHMQMPSPLRTSRLPPVLRVHLTGQLHRPGSRVISGAIPAQVPELPAPDPAPDPDPAPASTPREGSWTVAGRKLPGWLIRPSFAAQVIISVAMFLLHVLVLGRQKLKIPLSLSSKQPQSLGLDFVLNLCVAVWLLMRRGELVRKVLKQQDLKLPVKLKGSQRQGVLVTVGMLTCGWFITAQISPLIQTLLTITAAWLPMSKQMFVSLSVLLSHLAWVITGCKILSARCPKFFAMRGEWVKFSLGGVWVWWTVGGYYLSVFLSDLLIGFGILYSHLLSLLPTPSWLVPFAELLGKAMHRDNTVITDLMRPGSDWVAWAVGCVGPCFTGPLWEEVLYRGFLMGALSTLMPLQPAVEWCSLVFAAHHMNVEALSQLYLLGVVWSYLYIHSRNLLIPVAVHSLWNSRLFLNGLLGFT